jgi:tetratricopeptide (TPR) repeat protein
VLELSESRLGADHPDTLRSQGNLAAAYRAGGRTAEAIRIFEELLPADRKGFGLDHPQTLDDMNNLASAYDAAGRHDRSEPLLRECLSARERKWPDSWQTFNTRSQLGGSLMGRENYAVAEPLLIQGYEGLKARKAKIPAPSRTRLREAASRIVKLYESWGRPKKAAEWGDRLADDLPKGIDAGFPPNPFQTGAGPPEGVKP